MAKIRLQLGEPSFKLLTSDIVQKARPDLMFDFSMIDEFLNCHRSYLYRYEWHKTRLGGSAHSLIMGDGIHEAQKAHYLALKIGNLVGKRFDFETHSGIMKRAFLKAVYKDVLQGRFPLMIEHQPDGKRYVLNAFKILDAYLHQYPVEDWEVIDTELPIAYIIPFEYDGKTGEIIYIGRVDLLIKYLGHYHVVDHKTSSIMGKNFMASFRPNHQVSGYVAGISEIKGLPIHWAMLNAIGIYKNEPKFERERVRRETEELQSFQQQMINITREIFWYRERIKEGEEAEDVFYQNPRYCFKWNTACQFHIMCTKASKNARMTLMNSAYATRVWTPFEIHQLKKQEQEKSVA